MAEVFDCLVVGGGPAGLTAAIYLARFRLRVMVVDAGGGRCSLIPLTRNHAGFPGGVAGGELLSRMRTQAIECGALVRSGRIAGLRITPGSFAVDDGGEGIVSKTVLIATGVTNHRPQMSDAVHDVALRSGRLRYCPVCDGFEVTGRKVAVIGTGERGVKEAVFLRGYTSDVSLIAEDGPHRLSGEDRGCLEEASVRIVDGPATDFSLENDRIAFSAATGREVFDSVYPALGSDIHSALAASLGAKLTDEGCIKVDPHQRTTVPGLYAAGDVVVGLDQISHAMGEAGVAATAIRNDMAALSPLRHENLG